MGLKYLKLSVVIMLLAVVAACPHSAPRGEYEFAPPPSAWTPLKSSDGTLFFHRDNPSMGIMVGTECDRYQTVPLTPLSRTLFIGFENRKEISRGDATVDGNEAVQVVIECTMLGMPLKVKAYTFKAHNCIYDIAYFASPQDFDNGLGDFESFVSGFKAKPEE